MATKIQDFDSEVYRYIEKQYGANILGKVKDVKNKNIVDKVVESSLSQKDGINHTANKIIAMLRLNP